MTNDGGQNWTSTALNFSQDSLMYVNRLLIRPDKPDTIIAGTRYGIYIMSNNGSHLEDCSINGAARDGVFKDMEFHPVNPDTIYAASYSYGYSAVYRSTNGGQTFSYSFGSVNNLDIRRIELAVSPANPNSLYALCADREGKFQDLYYSTNSGSDWAVVPDNSLNLLGRAPDGKDVTGQGWYDLALTVSPLDQNEIHVGGINIWRTLNGGGEWTIASSGYNQDNNYVHVDHHILEYHPITGELFSGNDGGIYKTSNKGNSWTDLTSDLGILQIYRIGQSEQYSHKVMMGSQDNSSILADRNIYSVIKGGDGMECIIDPADTNIIYASSQYGNLGISYNGGIDLEFIQPDINDKGAWITPFILEPDDNNVLYAGYHNIYRTGNRGKHWTNLGSTLASHDKYRLLAIAPSNSDIITAANVNGLWISEDRARTWTEISSGLPHGAITGIAFDEYNYRKLWVSVSNYRENEKLYTSDDLGNSWQNYSEGLPNLPVNCIIIEKDSKSALYAGTDIGVFYRNRDMASWMNFSEGLPSVIVNELEIFYPESKIRAGTYGRGLWESELYEPPVLLPDAEFEASRQEACYEGQIMLVNHSTPDVDSLKWLLPDTLSTSFSDGKDTVLINYNTEGMKDIGLIIFKDLQADTLLRTGFIKIFSSIDITVIPDLEPLGGHIWKGDQVSINVFGGENIEWTPQTGLNTYTGKRVVTITDTSITYHVSAIDGQCYDEESVRLVVNQNDSIKNAVQLVYGENGPYINIVASVEENEPHPPLNDCNSQTDWCDEFENQGEALGNTVWFTFIAPTSEIVSIDTRGFDNQIAVYDALGPENILNGDYEILAANDDYYEEKNNFAASIRKILNLTTGKIYWLQVDGSGGNTQGSFYVTLNDFALPMPYRKPQLIIFPNPSKGDFRLRLNSDTETEALISVFNIHGQEVYYEKIRLQQGEQDYNLSSYLGRAGIYLVKVRSDSFTVVQKVIVE